MIFYQIATSWMNIITTVTFTPEVILFTNYHHNIITQRK